MQQLTESIKESAWMPGLYVVATPIGNMGDITVRALDILKKANLILAEDTRQTGKLLQYYGINNQIMSLHAHNEQKQLDQVERLISDNQVIALVSDAGTPAISDPGALLVHHLRQKNLAVFPVPGPNAAIAAMSVSGMISPQFLFYGFLPHQASNRKSVLNTLCAVDYPVIFYESPHRIKDTLADCEQCFEQDRLFILAKEMTKVFEHILCAKAADIIDWLTEERCRGEFVLIVLPEKDKQSDDREEELVRVLGILLKELPLKQAVKLTVDILQLRKNTVYAKALEMTKANES